jgi:hypothetical protein
MREALHYSVRVRKVKRPLRLYLLPHKYMEEAMAHCLQMKNPLSTNCLSSQR